MDVHNRCLKYLLIGNLSEMAYSIGLEFVLMGNNAALMDN